jgi:hypothetical protein
MLGYWNCGITPYEAFSKAEPARIHSEVSQDSIPKTPPVFWIFRIPDQSRLPLESLEVPISVLGVRWTQWTRWLLNWLADGADCDNCGRSHIVFSWSC